MDLAPAPGETRGMESPRSKERMSPLALGQARTAALVAANEDEAGRVWAWVDVGQGPERAALQVPLSAARLERIAAEQRPVIVYRAPGGLEVVAVVGLALAPPLAPLAPAGAPIEADVDGQRLRLHAEREIVLSCGKASITLRANGRVIIQGTQIESYAEGTNRIKGGQVRIN